jgi:hypothetical protein
MKTFKEALSLFQLQTGKTFARSRVCQSTRTNLYVLRLGFLQLIRTMNPFWEIITLIHI